MKPADLLQFPPMTPADFLRTARGPMDVPNAYLIIDVDKSTDDQLWARTPSQNDDWFSFPAAAVASLRPFAYADEMNLRRIVCEVNFVHP